MKTKSILDSLEIKFGYKENYGLEELTQVESLIINRYDVSKEIIEVDFNDLYNFTELKQLTIRGCILDNNIFNIIASIKNLNNLLLFDCEIFGDVENRFKSLNIDYLVLNNTDINLELLAFLTLEKLVLSNIKVNNELNVNTSVLDIQRCIFEHIEYFDINNVNQLIVSYSQFKKYNNYLEMYKNKLVIMEDNGQFVYNGGVI